MRIKIVPGVPESRNSAHIMARHRFNGEQAENGAKSVLLAIPRHFRTRLAPILASSATRKLRFADDVARRKRLMGKWRLIDPVRQVGSERLQLTTHLRRAETESLYFHYFLFFGLA
jgi:hypothetical protein